MTSSGAQTNSQVQIHEIRQPMWRASSSDRLPSICVYFGWILCILTALTSAFFTILYSLEWGGDRSNRWLVAFLLTFVQSVSIFSTTQIIVIVVLLAFIARVPETDIEFDDREIIAKHVQASYSNVASESNTDIEESPEIEADSYSLQVHKFVGFLKDFLLRLVYVAAILCIALESRDTNAYWQRKQLTDVFIETNHSRKISGPVAFWQWTENKLLPGLYAQTWYNDRLATWRERRYEYNRESFRIGPARLRQLRIKPASCGLVGKVASILLECNPEYSLTHEDKRHYFENWVYKPWNLTSAYLAGGSPFIHHSEADLDGLPVFGEYMYSGGGYVAHLSEELEDAVKTIQTLKSTDWVNLYTRAVVVECTLYNANIDLFSNVIFLVELPPAGGSLTMLFIDTFRIYGSFNDIDAAFISKIVILVLAIYYTVKIINDLIKQKVAVFKDLSSIIDMVQVCLVYASVALYIARQLLVSQAVKKVFSAKDTFVNFQKLAVASQTYVAVLGLTIFVNLIQLLRILQVSWRFRVVARILTLGATTFRDFVIQFAIILWAYSQFYYLHLGAVMAEYSTPLRTVESMVAVFLGGGRSFSPADAIGGNKLARGVFYAYAVHVIFIWTNIFISSLVDIFETANSQLQEERKFQNFDPVEYVSGRFKLAYSAIQNTMKRIIIWKEARKAKYIP